MSAKPSKSRRIARELAYQALYMVHVGRATVENAITTVLQIQPLDAVAEDFLRTTVKQVSLDRLELDRLIEGKLSKNWTLKRIAVSDLIALRLATYELFSRPGIPPKVTITEALELAKKYGTADSGPFVNGVLGSLLPESPKAHWTPEQEEVLEPDHERLPDAEPEEDAEVEIEAGSEEHSDLMKKAGAWVIRKEDE